MAQAAPAIPPDLPAGVREVLGRVVEATTTAFGDHLVSVILYGSAAEGRLRPTSDVNVLLVLRAFDSARADALREPLRFAQAAVRLSLMLVLESELPRAAEAFADRFADIARRHHVLFGADVVKDLRIAKPVALARLGQSLLNQRLRLREAYLSRSLREEQAALAVADFAGPLRACAAQLLELEGTPAPSPREALERIVKDLRDPALERATARLPVVRQERRLPPGVAGPTLLQLGEIAARMLLRADRLGGDGP
jgi:predicted nucleotidyltransferase